MKSAYEESGHARRWVFGAEELGRLRDGACQSAGSPLVGSTEEALLVRFYAAQTLSICRAQRLPPRVGDAAALFFARLYVRASLRRAPGPKAAMAACVVLAAKAEEHWAPRFAERLCAAMRVDAGAALAFEPQLLAALRFDVRVFHPRRALAGLRAALFPPNAAAADDEAAAASAQFEEEEERVLAAAMASDAPLTCAPAHVALAVLRRARGAEKVDAALRKLLHDDEAKKVLECVARAEAAIAEVLDNPPPREQLADLDRRLKASLAPSPAAVKPEPTLTSS